MAKLTVQLVTWNGEKYISDLFASLKKQSFQDWELVMLDNASTDGTLDHIKKECAALSVSVKIIEGKNNIGFAGGHNQLFREFQKKHQASDYVLLLNQDMYLEAKCFERMVQFLNMHSEVGAVSPRLMKWDMTQTKQFSSDIIDSLGLKVFRSRRVVEWYTGERWSEVASAFSDSAVEVFGVSGALPMYRVRALREAAFLDGSVFDPSYHSYKEDVDLAFRLRSAGYRAHTLLDTVAYHDRSAAGPHTPDDLAAVKNKAAQSAYVRYQSYKNHLATLYKNTYWQSMILDFPWIFWYELKKFLYYLFFDTQVLKGLGDLWKARKDLRRRKDEISAKRKVNWREMWKHIGATT